MDRRAYLARAVAGVGAVTAFTGCLERDEVRPADGGTTDESTSFEDHPATADVDAQPFHGPEPGTATATIVAFEDPSCARCAAFERKTVPKIRSELIEPGDATFVFRGYPVVFPWGEPATKALEATFARDDAAHWSLLHHYMANQGQFSNDTVLDATGDFLARETSVDGEAVAAAVREGATDEQVEGDLAAGEAAGVGRVTPTVFLFRDGEYRTKARGSVSFEAVRTALGL